MRLWYFQGPDELRADASQFVRPLCLISDLQFRWPIGNLNMQKTCIFRIERMIEFGKDGPVTLAAVSAKIF